MKKFDGILICTDLDGTLLRADKSISPENLEAIEYFMSEGGYFTFITGRMPFYVRDIYETVKPNAPIGCVNGGGIYDFHDERYLWTREMPRSVAELIEYAHAAMPEIGIQISTFEKAYFCNDNEAMKRFRALTGLPNLTCRLEDIREPIAKILFGDTREENINKLKALLDAHARANEFSFIRSEYTLYEILPKGTSKGCILPRLSEILNIRPERIAAVGDYNNDVAMLREAGVGIAVSNATDEAKAAADYITVSNEEHAIARIISDIDKGILKI